MSVQWTERSAADIEGIYDAIASDRPRAAKRVVSELVAKIEGLDEHPYRGRPGRDPKTRELVIPGLPYIVVYEVWTSLTESLPRLIIMRVIHGAMRWPPK